MTFKCDLLVRPATPLAAPPPFAPAQVIQLLDGGGEAQQVVQLLVSEETGGGHLHLQTIGEVPQGANAVLHDLTHVLQLLTGNQCPPRTQNQHMRCLNPTGSRPLCILLIFDQQI